MQIPYLDVSTVQAAGVSPFFGGVQMYWTAEAQTRTETEPQFKQMELKAWELSGYSVSSNVLLQDSVIGLEKFLMTLFAKSLAWFEEYAFLQGNGAGKPQGMLTAAAAVSLNRQGANQVQFADVAGMWAKLLPISWSKAIWTCSPSVVPAAVAAQGWVEPRDLHQHRSGSDEVAELEPARPAGVPDGEGPGAGHQGRSDAARPQLLRPRRPDADRDRRQSEHVNFLKNQMTWRVVERVDGQPWLDKPVTLQDAVTQVSPFVVLN